MKKTLLFTMLAVILLAVSSQGAMTYDAASILKNAQNVTMNSRYNNPLYLFANEVEGYIEGTSVFPSISILESTGATYYTKFQGGNQSANLTLTLPTAYAATTGYVLSSTDAGVLSWVANAGTWSGGAVSSDATLANGVDILSGTTTAWTNSIQGYADAGAYKDVLRWTNGAAVTAVLGASDVVFSLASTGLDISTAGAISNATTIQASGVITATGGVALQNGATLTNAVDSEITLTDTSEDLTGDSQ